MSSTPEIRPASAEDLQPAIRLLAQAGLPTGDLTIERLALVAEQDGEFVGAIGLESFGATGLLRSLVVDPGQRTGGLGRLLVAALEELAAGKGVHELWLLTIDADAYFEKLGYAREPRSAAPAAIAATEEFSSLCPGDAVLMKKNLRRA